MDTLPDALLEQIKAINDATISAYERGRKDGYDQGYIDGLKKAQAVVFGPKKEQTDEAI